MVWEIALKILAALSIPSILWNIFLFYRNQKYKKLEAEKDLKIKEIEFEEEIVRGEKEYNEELQKSNVIYSHNNPYDIIEASKLKLKKLSAEIEHLSKISGKKPSFSLISKKENFWDKIKSKLKLN